MVGINFCHARQYAEEPRLLLDLLEIFEGIGGGPRLSWFRGAFRGTDSFTRWRRLVTKNLTQLRTDLAGRVYASMIFTNDRAAQHREPLPDHFIELHIDIARDGAPPEAKYPFDTRARLPDKAFESQAGLEAGIKLYTLLASPYGFVHTADDDTDIWMELTSIAFRRFGETHTPEEERRFARLEFWQRKTAHAGAYVRTAYWGNFLGTEIVGRLGGQAKVRAEAPAEVAEELPDGGVYLQLTRDPRDRGSATFTAARQRLADFLKPASFHALFPEEGVY